MKFMFLVPFLIASCVGMLFVAWLPIIAGQ